MTKAMTMAMTRLEARGAGVAAIRGGPGDHCIAETTRCRWAEHALGESSGA